MLGENWDEIPDPGRKKIPGWAKILLILVVILVLIILTPLKSVIRAAFPFLIVLLPTGFRLDDIVEIVIIVLIAIIAIPKLIQNKDKFWSWWNGEDKF